jgi:glycosyltransferase involved in cell wall biosynthesis
MLQTCLEHLDRLTSSLISRVVVVDNNSTDGSKQWLQTLTEKHYRVLLLDRNLGFAGGCNLGIQHTTGDDILLLNTDAFLSARALDILVRYLDWRWQFYLNIPAGVLAAASAYWALRGLPQVKKETSLDLRGALLLAAGLVALNIAVSRSECHDVKFGMNILRRISANFQLFTSNPLNENRNAVFYFSAVLGFFYFLFNKAFIGLLGFRVRKQRGLPGRLVRPCE